MRAGRALSAVVASSFPFFNFFFELNLEKMKRVWLALSNWMGCNAGDVSPCLMAKEDPPLIHLMLNACRLNDGDPQQILRPNIHSNRLLGRLEIIRRPASVTE